MTVVGEVEVEDAKVGGFKEVRLVIVLLDEDIV